MEQVTVLIVDDHAVVRRGVTAFFETQPGIVVVGEAPSGEEAVRLAATCPPDVAMVDLVMPGIGGVEATRRLRALDAGIRVLVLTSFHDDAHLLPAIRAGASSYLLKDARPADLVAAVRRTARGESVLDPRVAGLVVRELRGEEGRSLLAALSAREREVLDLLADGLGNAALAERLAISEKTVKSHVASILAKLGLEDRTQAAVFAWREGIKRRPDRSSERH